MLTRFFRIKEAENNAIAGQWKEALCILADEKLTMAKRMAFIEIALRQGRDDAAMQLFRVDLLKIESELNLAHLAALRNCPLFLDAMLSAGEDVHKIHVDETTLLEVTAFKGNLECLDVVVKHGATAGDWHTSMYRNINSDVLLRLGRLGLKLNDTSRKTAGNK